MYMFIGFGCKGSKRNLNMQANVFCDRRNNAIPLSRYPAQSPNQSQKQKTHSLRHTSFLLL